jgi:glyoxylase-like metal-dependent hydrolase (beta-lactamase superfamily II)
MCGSEHTGAAASNPEGLLIALIALIALGASAVLPVHAQEAGSLETIQIRPSVYVIFGGGSNVIAQVGDEGVILVDSGSAAAASKVRAAVAALTSQPVRLIVNTSADADHVGGNEALARGGRSINPNAFNAGAEQAAVLAHENVLMRMSAPTGQQAAFPLGSWPTETYTSRTKSLYLNDEGIQVIRETGAHSDGDSVVFFRRADVIATGDIVDVRQFPVIDTARGGSIQGEIDALNRLLELAIPAMPLIYKDARTYLVPGHGRIIDHAELVEYRDMVTIIRDIVQRMIDKGMSLDQVKAANPTQGYRRRYGSDTGPWTTDMFVEAVYRGLTRSRAAASK